MAGPTKLTLEEMLLQDADGLLQVSQKLIGEDFALVMKAHATLVILAAGMRKLDKLDDSHIPK